MVAQERITTELLGILQAYAPTGTDQALCTELLNMAATHGADERDQHLLLAGALCDGLRYGNWPWTIENPKRDSWFGQWGPDGPIDNAPQT